MVSTVIIASTICVLCALLIATQPPRVAAYPAGAPVGACTTQSPYHTPFALSSGDGGYSLSFSNTTWSPATPITVYLANSSAAISGVLGSAFNNIDGNRVGSWDYATGFRAECGNAITQSIKFPCRTVPCSLTYTPPDSTSTATSLTFQFTVVQSYSKFYKIVASLPRFVLPGELPSSPLLTLPYQTMATTTSLQIQWSAPLVGGNSISYYTVQQLNSTKNSTFIPIASCTKITQTTCTLTGLTENTKYYFRVRAVSTANLTGDWTGTFPAATLSSTAAVPSTPNAPTSTSANQTTIGISWTTPNMNGYDLVSWAVQIKPDGQLDSQYVITDLGYRASDLTYSFTGLSSATYYIIQVRVTSLAGSSSWSSALNISTTAFSACPNGCSGGGTCSQGVCFCNANRLGLDCNTTASAAQLGGGATVASAIIGTRVYVQFSCPTLGWCGMMLNPGSDGMSGGDLWLFSFDGLEDRQGGSGFVTPNAASVETQNLENGQSWTDGNRRYVSFSRLLVTGDTHDADISATSEMKVSYAYGASIYFAQHSASQRGQASVNFALGTSTPTVDLTQKQLLVPGLISLFVLLISIVFLHSKGVRTSKVGICCLRVKCCPAGCRTNQRSWFDDTTLDVRFALQDMVWSEFIIVVLYAAAVVVYLVISRMSYNDASRDYVYVTGYLAGWHLALTILPISRTAPWIKTLGISFERAVKWHRWVARVTVILATIHGALMYQKAADGINSMGSRTATRDGAGTLYGALAWLCFSVMLVAAYEPIRRKFFEVFYYSHHLFIAGIVFACLHSYTTFYCCIIGIVLWFIDRCIRLYSSSQVTVKSARALHGSETVTKLEVQKKGFNYQGGDFCFINVPSISLFQWHPFSISSALAAPGESFTFHIMDMGAGEWTNKLAAIAPQIASGERSMYIDGPYGNLSIALQDYTHIVLCAGGVGVTPMMSILHQLYIKHTKGELGKVKAVHLIWCCSNEGPLRSWFKELLTQMNKSGAPFHLHLYATGAKKPQKETGVINATTIEMASFSPLSPSEKKENGETGSEEVEIPLKVITGCRPNYEQLFGPILASAENHGSNVGVLACGPHPMIQSVQTEAIKSGFHLHKETFFL